MNFVNQLLMVSAIPVGIFLAYSVPVVGTLLYLQMRQKIT